MMEGAFSSTEKQEAIASLRAIGTAQQNASLLLRELRDKCRHYGMELQFLQVMGAFAEGERVAAQELRKLLDLVKPLPTPEQAVRQCHEAVQHGMPVDEANAELAQVRAHWRQAGPDHRMRAAGDHSFDEERTADVADERR